MAAGDFVFFDQFLTDLGNKIHDMDTDTYKFGLVTATTTPANTAAAPHFGGTGTTNYATNQVSAGGNYAAGGPAIANPSWAVAAAILKYDFDDVSILQNASNPTNARWAIVYNDTDANKRCVGYLDLGTTVDLSAGDFGYTPDATNGVARIGVGTIA